MRENRVPRKVVMLGEVGRGKSGDGVRNATNVFIILMNRINENRVCYYLFLLLSPAVSKKSEGHSIRLSVFPPSDS